MPMLAVIVDLERLLHRVEDAFRHQLGAGGQGDPVGEDHELIAAEAPERVGLPDRALEP